MSIITHHIPVTTGQAHHMTLRLVQSYGAPVALSDYTVYGSILQDGETIPVSVTGTDSSGILLTLPPLYPGRHPYNLHLKHNASGTDYLFLQGNCDTSELIGADPMDNRAVEQITVAMKDDLSGVTVTMQIDSETTAGAWEEIEAVARKTEGLQETISNLIPEARIEIAQATDMGKNDIAATTQTAIATITTSASETAEATLSTINTASATIMETAKQDMTSFTVARQQDLETTAASGQQAISTAVTTGTGTINAAVTTGTGTINTAVANGKTSIDNYVAATQADFVRKSQANIWTGIQTFNAPAYFNGGIVMQPTSANTSISTHMSARMWWTTYATERTIPYVGKWTWSGLGTANITSYTSLDNTTYHTSLFSRARTVVSALMHPSASMADQCSVIGIEGLTSGVVTPLAYPWDFGPRYEVKLTDTRRHGVPALNIMMSQIGQSRMGWRMIYPSTISDVQSIQMLGKNIGHQLPIYAIVHTNCIRALECIYNVTTHPDLNTYNAGSNITYGTTVILCRKSYRISNPGTTVQIAPMIDINIPTSSAGGIWATPRWPEEIALYDAADKSWVDWRYARATLTYTSAAVESPIISSSSNIGRHIYITAGAQDIGLFVAVYRPKSGDDTLLPDDVVVDIDTAATAWVTHSDGALHLSANTTGEERIASVWLYSDQLVGTIYELQIHQFAS